MFDLNFLHQTNSLVEAAKLTLIVSRRIMLEVSSFAAPVALWPHWGKCVAWNKMCISNNNQAANPVYFLARWLCLWVWTHLNAKTWFWSHFDVETTQIITIGTYMINQFLTVKSPNPPGTLPLTAGTCALCKGSKYFDFKPLTLPSEWLDVLHPSVGDSCKLTERQKYVCFFCEFGDEENLSDGVKQEDGSVTGLAMRLIVKIFHSLCRVNPEQCLC